MTCSIIKNSAKSIFVFLLIIFAWILFEEKLVGIFDKNIYPYLSTIEFSNLSTILFVLIISFPSYAIYKCFKNRYYIPLLSFLILLFVVLLYIKYRVFGIYISTPVVFANLGYTDILVTLLVIFLISSIYSFVCFKRKRESLNSIFMADTPICEPQFDILDYSESAKLLAKDLETIQIESSCSIGIIAPWGTGKTSYLNLLEYHLNNKEFIIVKYNPRHSYSSKEIQGDFFEELFSELKKYDSRFSSSFTDYLKAINIISDDKILPFLFDIHKLWNKNSEKEKINHAIRRLNKRIVVIIEDFDRLLSDEIIEVFKLIDGNASFTNLIFITAYDKKHINEIVGKTYSNEHTLFSDKFFTIEIQIPLRPYDKIFDNLLNNLLANLSINTEDKESYKIVLANHVDLLKKYITTLRDVKRFLNLFTRQFKQVQGEVEFEDYFLLYLVKYKYLDEYLNLYKKEFISTDITKAPNQYFLVNNIDVKSMDVLNLLFGDTTRHSLRSINNEIAFDIYFHESIYNGLPLRQMESMFDIDFEDAKQLIDRSVSDELFQDVINFLDAKNVLTFKSKEHFERYLDILIYINNRGYDTTVSYFKILSLLYINNRNQLKPIYQYQDDEYKNTISEKLEGIYPDYPFNFTKGIIIGIINKEFKEDIILNKDDLLMISSNALDNLIANDNRVKQIHIDLLYSCIEDINQESRVVSLSHEACSKIKSLLEATPSGYFENFVRLGMISLNKDFNSVACEPFWYQIYGNADEFESFINRQNTESVPNIELINNFWKLYKNNSYKPIEFQNQGNVQDKINNNLVDEVGKLNQLLKIEQQFNEYENDRAATPRKKDDEFYLKQYKGFLTHIDNIGLYISKTGDIVRKIKMIRDDILSERKQPKGERNITMGDNSTYNENNIF